MAGCPGLNQHIPHTPKRAIVTNYTVKVIAVVTFYTGWLLNRCKDYKDGREKSINQNLPCHAEPISLNQHTRVEPPGTGLV